MAMGYQPVQRGTVNFGWISEAWQIFMANAVTWVVVTIITGVIVVGVVFGLEVVFGITAVISTGAAAAASSGTAFNPLSMYGSMLAMPMSWLVIAIAAVLSSFFNAGLFRMANAAVRGQAIEIGMLFQGGPYMLPVLLTQLAIGIAGGIVGCTIVGPFLIYGIFGPAFALAADGEPVGEALTKSLNAMKPQWLMAGVFAFVMFLIVAVSEIPCGIGLLATMPMLLICASLAYRDMIGMPGAAAPGSGSVNAFGQAQTGQWPPPPGQQTGQGWQPGQPVPGQQPPDQTSVPYTNQPLAGTTTPTAPSAYDAPTPTSNSGLEELPPESPIEGDGDPTQSQ